MSVAVYCRQFVKKVVEQRGQAQDKTMVAGLIMIFYKCIVCPTLRFDIKKQLGVLFETLIMIYGIYEQNPQSLMEFYSNLFSSVQVAISSNQTEVIKGALIICQATMSTMKNLKLLTQVFTGIATLMTSILTSYLEKLKQDFANFHS
jgi:hypothetical protein